MPNETQKEMIIRIDERTEQIPIINSHLAKLNDKVSDTNIKLAKAREIAEAADERSKGNRKYIDKLVIATITASAALVLSIAAIITQIVVK